MQFIETSSITRARRRSVRALLRGRLLLPAVRPRPRRARGNRVLRRVGEPERAAAMTDLVQRAPRTTRWVVTVGATALSAYALDAVATAAGVALAASHLLRDFDQVLLIGFLVATYVAWGAGLRVNLQANWALLEDTGTSTNAFSKAGYELSKLRGLEPARPQAVHRDRLRGHRAREGGALLRGRVRRRAGQRFRLLEGRPHLPRGREPRRRALRVRAGPRHTRVPAPAKAARLVRVRVGAEGVPGRLLQRRRAGRARDDRLLRGRDGPGGARQADPVLRRRPDPPSRLPRRGQGIGDPPGGLPAGEPRGDRALASARSRRPRLGAVRSLHAGVRGSRGSERRTGARP